MQAYVVLKKELRVLHLDWKAAERVNELLGLAEVSEN